jgi:hypothetical protein
MYNLSIEQFNPTILKGLLHPADVFGLGFHIADDLDVK